MTELPDLTEVVPEGSITLPIRGVQYRFTPCSAALGYVLSKTAAGGKAGIDLLPDDRTAPELRDLLGEHYDVLGPLDGDVRLSHPEFEHLLAVLVMFNLFGRETAERLWVRSPEQWAPAAAADKSSAGAPARTASTSGTSTTTGPRSTRNRKRRR